MVKEWRVTVIGGCQLQFILKILPVGRWRAGIEAPPEVRLFQPGAPGLIWCGCAAASCIDMNGCYASYASGTPLNTI